MGKVFDREASEQYALWAQGPQGQAMDRWIESCLPGLLRIHPGERVLDIGCGHGSHLLLLKRLGLDTSGVDASPHMIKRARERLGQSCNLKTAMADDLPFEDNAFDISVMIHTLEFLENPLEALREAGRVTRRALFIAVMNSFSWNGVVRKISLSSSFPHLSGCRYYSLWQLKALVQAALGSVPVKWHSSSSLQPVIARACSMVTGSRFEPSLPFGSFIGVSAEIVYRFKTDNLTLRVPARARRHSVVDGATMGEHNRSSGARSHERGLSI